MIIMKSLKDQIANIINGKFTIFKFSKELLEQTVWSLRKLEAKRMIHFNSFLIIKCSGELKA
ncbi:hypothetical protein WR51_28895 (plasmid) [Bacillus cereus]|nr:hypothetical protein WR47_29770 [Bacillus cereus]ANC16956.1 hypothetical protein WR51_28895 [Bacillus cereus]PFS47125.1 hypothetical protein COK44_17300 [Bacillus cereus]